MKALIVVNRAEDWPHEIPGAAVATAKDYLTGEAANNDDYRQVLNLCRCVRTDDAGFYVSLLAEARGHRPLPSARALEEARTPADAAAVRELEKLAAESAPRTSAFEVDAYFGADPSGQHAALAQQLFSFARMPLLRANFRRRRGQWRLHRVRALSPGEIAPQWREELIRAVTRYVTGTPTTKPAARGEQPSIAILHTPDEPLPPSNKAALEKFVAAAQGLGMRAEIIDRQAIERLADFDALFLRDTTFLDHYTYQFAQRAAALGLVVMDDPDSIVQCNNKVYLNELLTRQRIAVPPTVMVHRDNVADVIPALGLPVVLKEPGGGFSTGVRKAASPEELEKWVAQMLEKSELIIAQRYMPTEYDWRVTILDRRVLFVCKYFMAPGHWQVHKYEGERHDEGRTTALTVGEAPRAVVDTALRAANLIGDGLYGVDLKLVDGRAYVMEINDNPSIDAGNEDQILKDALYRDVMGVFLRRITERSATAAASA